MNKLKVRYFAPFAKNSGYAQAAHDYLAALHATGQVELDIRPIHECDTDKDLHERFQHLVPFCELDDSYWGKGPDVVVVHTIPEWANEFVSGDLAPNHLTPKVAITTWETDRLPKSAADKLTRDFDLVIVPSLHNKVVFSKANKDLACKTVIVPHGFDFKVFEGAWSTPKPKTSPYVFYSILVWAERKNPMALLKAYLTEFKADEDVLLKILTPAYNEDDLVNLVRCMGLENLPKVQFITARLSDAELMNLHATSHCYATLTHGEGWGLGAFEAAIVGNHVIGTGWSGQLDFLKTCGGDEIGYFMTPAIASEQILQKGVTFGNIEVKPVSKFVSAGVDASQNWAEPNIDDAKRFMRRAFNERRGRSEYGRNKMIDRYEYKRIGQNLLEALRSAKVNG